MELQREDLLLPLWEALHRRYDVLGFLDYRMLSHFVIPHTQGATALVADKTFPGMLWVETVSERHFFRRETAHIIFYCLYRCGYEWLAAEENEYSRKWLKFLGLQELGNKIWGLRLSF